MNVDLPGSGGLLDGGGDRPAESGGAPGDEVDDDGAGALQILGLGRAGDATDVDAHAPLLA